VFSPAVKQMVHHRKIWAGLEDIMYKKPFHWKTRIPFSMVRWPYSEKKGKCRFIFPSGPPPGQRPERHDEWVWSGYHASKCLPPPSPGHLCTGRSTWVCSTPMQPSPSCLKRWSHSEDRYTLPRWFHWELGLRSELHLSPSGTASSHADPMLEMVKECPWMEIKAYFWIFSKVLSNFTDSDKT
jgi:hypothetical protein